MHDGIRNTNGQFHCALFVHERIDSGFLANRLLGKFFVRERIDSDFLANRLLGRFFVNFLNSLIGAVHQRNLAAEVS